MKLKKDEFSCGITFLFAGLIYASQISKIQISKLSPINARFLPIIFVCGMLLLSVMELFLSFNPKGLETTMDGADVRKKDYFCVAFSLLLSLCYVLFLPSLGFVISSFLYLFVQMLLFAPQTQRKPIQLFFISAMASLIIYMVFRGALSLMLPNGILTKYF